MRKVIDWVREGDTELFIFLNSFLRSSLLDRLMQLITYLGGAVCSTALAIILLLQDNQVYHKAGEQLALNLLFSHLLVRLGKKYLPRSRPHMAMENVNTGSQVYLDASFPSGHATAGFCSAVILASVWPKFSPLFFVLAALVAVSRVYLGMHYPSDTMAGAFLGIITAEITLFIFS